MDRAVGKEIRYELRYERYRTNAVTPVTVTQTFGFEIDCPRPPAKSPTGLLPESKMTQHPEIVI